MTLLTPGRLVGAVFAVASVTGPLLGGAFSDGTHGLSWRFCFWINLPFGAFTIAAISFLLPSTAPPPLDENVALYTERKIQRWTGGRWKPSRSSVGFKLAVLDWTGAFIILAVITCLLLCLQWGGTTYAWNSGIIIGTFVAFAVLLVIFVAYEKWGAGDSGILPLRLFRNRTQVGACLAALFLMLVLLEGTYFLPICESTRLA